MDEGIKLLTDRPTDRPTERASERIPGGVCNAVTTFPRARGVQINDHYKFALPSSVSGKRHNNNAVGAMSYCGPVQKYNGSVGDIAAFVIFCKAYFLLAYSRANCV